MSRVMLIVAVIVYRDMCFQLQLDTSLMIVLIQLRAPRLVSICCFPRPPYPLIRRGGCLVLPPVACVGEILVGWDWLIVSTFFLFPNVCAIAGF